MSLNTSKAEKPLEQICEHA